MGPPDRSWVPRAALGAFRNRFRASPEGSWRLENHAKYSKNRMFYEVSCLSAFLLVIHQNRPRKPSKRGLPEAQERRRRPQGRPKRFQDDPKRRQERPKSAPRAAQVRLPSGLGGQMGPTWRRRAVRRAPGGHFGPSTVRFSTLRGAIFAWFSTHRKACSKLACGQSLCKHTASTARRLYITSACVLVRRRTAGQ